MTFSHEICSIVGILGGECNVTTSDPPLGILRDTFQGGDASLLVSAEPAAAG